MGSSEQDLCLSRQGSWAAPPATVGVERTGYGVGRYMGCANFMYHVANSNWMGLALVMEKTGQCQNICCCMGPSISTSLQEISGATPATGMQQPAPNDPARGYHTKDTSCPLHEFLIRLLRVVCLLGAGMSHTRSTGSNPGLVKTAVAPWMLIELH